MKKSTEESLVKDYWLSSRLASSLKFPYNILGQEVGLWHLLDSFLKRVHEHNLTELQKFNYLLSSLRGEAKQSISRFHIAAMVLRTVSLWNSTERSRIPAHEDPVPVIEGNYSTGYQR